MESVWTHSANLRSFPALQENIHTDVCVIGGGMAGLLTAYKLQKRGFKTVVLEANKIGSGATAFTTAKITSLHGLIYSRIAQNYSLDTAGLYARANEKAINDYEEIITEKGIACSFSRLPHFVYSMKSEEQLQTELGILQKIGLPGEFVKDTELPLPIAGAVKLPNQAQFHPLQFLAGILDGMEIYENTRATAVENGKVAAGGAAVEAGYVVVATHYPFLNMPGWYFTRLHQERSYLTALKKAPVLSGMYIDADPNGMTFRPYENYLLMGMGNHRTGENTAGGYYQELSEAARRLFPHTVQAFQWSNQDCMTPDKMPFIGKYAGGTPNVYVATGFNQWGMSGAMVAAECIKCAICGEEKQEVEIFSAQRFKWKAMKSELNRHMKTSFQGLWQGAYPEPAVHRCSHMGCILNRNPDDQTWECACHGSRFGDDGGVLNGPAQKPFTLNRESQNTGK